MAPSSSVFREDLRQLEHLLPVSLAFLLKYLNWNQALILAFLAILYALFISPHILPSTQRPDELRKRFFTGKVAYAFSVFMLIAFFKDVDFIVVVVWANLSVGDAASNVIGRKYGRSPLPWNQNKTWIGTGASVLFSSLVSLALVLWTGIPSAEGPLWKSALLYSISTSVICSLAESLPLPLDDNITICIAGGSFLAWITMARWPGEWNPEKALLGFVISFSAGLAAYLAKTVTINGFLIGAGLGTLVFVAFGASGFLMLGTFFVLGNLFTRIGFRTKERMGRPEANRVRRSSYHVLGKGFAALAASGASLFLSDKTHITVGFTAAVTAALYDTTATELGQLLGKKHLLLRSCSWVSPGTPGAISLAGSLAGVVAGGIIALEAVYFGLMDWWAFLCVVIAATLAVHLESYWAGGSPIPVSGRVLNAMHTTAAMLSAMILLNLRM